MSSPTGTEMSCVAARTAAGSGGSRGHGNRPIEKRVQRVTCGRQRTVATGPRSITITKDAGGVSSERRVIDRPRVTSVPRIIGLHPPENISVRPVAIPGLRGEQLLPLAVAAVIPVLQEAALHVEEAMSHRQAEGGAGNTLIGAGGDFKNLWNECCQSVEPGKGLRNASACRRHWRDISSVGLFRCT